MDETDSVTNQPINQTVSFNAWISNWPVVNVTKSQAELYCEFRTSDYQVYYNSQKPKKKVKYPSRLFFRLPTPGEWVYAASSGLDTTKHRYGVENDNPNYIPVSMETFNSDSTGQSHPFAVTNCTITSKKQVTEPKNDIGFRIVAVVK